MREQVQAILDAAGAKLRRERIAEGATVAATAAALSAAAIQAAWFVAWKHPWFASAVCVVPLAIGAVLLVNSKVRQVLDLDRVLARAVGLACILLAAGAMWSFVSGQFRDYDPYLITLAALAIGLPLGAVAAWVAGPTSREAAILLDAKCQLRERLSTAGELLQREEQGPFVDALFAQVVDLARQKELARVPMWRRTRATAGALGLAVLLCLAMNLLPLPRPPTDQQLAQSLVKNVESLTPQQRADLIKALADAAAKSADPKVQENLQAARAAVEQADAAALQKAMELLVAGKVEIKTIVPPSLGGTGMEAGIGADQHANAGGVTPTPAPTPTPSVTPTEIPSGPIMVRVLVPHYNVTTAATGSATVAPSSPSDMVPWNTAWDAARARAEADLSRGSIPPEYRQLVRDYFAGN